MNSLKQELKEYAEKIGIDLFGVTTTEPFLRYLEELETRKEHYIERYSHRIDRWKRLTHPRKVLKDAKAVISIGFYYYTDDKEPKGLYGKIGRIVSYGHLEIFKRALLIVDFLKGKGYKAVMGLHRKEAAQRAGLGYIGKNGLVINDKYGSWVAYQSIVTNAEIDFDKPYEGEECGKCEICMNSCPTSAIYEPHRINPKRCISYLLTSENIPSEFEEKTGNYLLGCDVCQEICPKNKGLKPKEKIEPLLPPFLGSYPPLKKVLELTEKEFKAKVMGYIFKRTPIPPLAKYKWIRQIFKVLERLKILKGSEAIPETFIHASDDLRIYKRSAMLAIKNIEKGNK